MLYRVILDNYRSFGETTQFDMFPNPKRENLKEHVYVSNDVQLLKMAAVYGANGAGKSNLVKALQTLKNLCTKIHIDPNNGWSKSWYESNRFKLPVRPTEDPVSMMVEFSTKLSVYIYNVEIGPEGIRKEELSQSGLGRKKNSPIFKRIDSKIDFYGISVSKTVSEIFDRQLKSQPENSVLAINGSLKFLSNEKMDDAYNWFRNSLHVFDVDRYIPEIIDLYRRDKELMQFASDFIGKIDAGIMSVKVEDKPFDTWMSNLSDSETKSLMNQFAGQKIKNFVKVEENRPSVFVHESDGSPIVSEMIFKQIGQGGYTGEMDIQAQSDGTIRLLNLIPPIFLSMTADLCIVVDELDRGIHPRLIKEMIRYFGRNPSKGQLIFTTHEDYLLDQRNLIRPDEVWLVDKKDGISRLYSLNSFKPHKTLSMQNGYMEGRYGGVPEVELNED